MDGKTSTEGSTEAALDCVREADGDTDTDTVAETEVDHDADGDKDTDDVTTLPVGDTLAEASFDAVGDTDMLTLGD